jgi:hypothetical protein
MMGLGDTNLHLVLIKYFFISSRIGRRWRKKEGKRNSKSVPSHRIIGLDFPYFPNPATVKRTLLF